MGVVLYWLLTGRLPCEGATAAEQAEATLFHVPAPPHAVNPRVPGALSALCMKLLEKQPGDRFADAERLGEAVEAELERADEAWSVPLCDVHGPDNLTTEGVQAQEHGIEEVDHALRVARHAEERPRRGRRPVPAAPAAAPLPPPEVEAIIAPPPPAAPAEAAPAEAAPAPSELQVEAPAVPRPEPSSLVLAKKRSEAQPPRAGLPRLLPWAALALGLVALLAVALRPPLPVPSSRAPASGREEPHAGSFTVASEPTWETTWKVGWKIAPPWKVPEDGRHHFFATGEAAVVEAPPESEQGKALMKDPQKKKLGAMGKAAATGTACVTLACTAPQVRPEPPAEPCPPGALEAMAGLNIKIGHKATGVLPGPVASIIPVREGWTSVQIIGAFSDLPPDAILKGRLIFGGERVSGRFTEAREYKGTRTWPVCMELGFSGKRGLELEPGSTADTPKVFSTVHAYAVDHFK